MDKTERKILIGTPDGIFPIDEDDLDQFTQRIRDASSLIEKDVPFRPIWVQYHVKGSERYIRLDQITWFGWSFSSEEPKTRDGLN